MKFSLSMAFTGLLVGQAAATIRFGTQGGSKVAWLDGDNPCNDIKQISSSSQVPCDRFFTLRNGFTYVLRDCGTPSFSLWNSDGSFNHIGVSKGKNIGCDNVADVHQEWVF